MSQILCPACSKPLVSNKAIPKHVQGCKEWRAKIGIPASEFNFDKHYGRGLYAPELMEGVDYVLCLLCPDVRRARLADHLKTDHKLTPAQYLTLYPAASVYASAVHQKRSTTVRQKYGVDNAFQSQELMAKARETMIERYGAANPLQAPSIRERVAATNLARYGADNPFGAESVKQKIKDVNRERYGVDNPNQCPEIIARRKATNRQRYGKDHFFETDTFKAQFRAMCRERYGAPHHMQSALGRVTFHRSFQAKYGVDHPFQSKAVLRKAYETNLRNHGGKHSQQCPEVLEKARKVWLEKYGVDNPSKDPGIKEKITEAIKARFESGAWPRMTRPERIYDAMTPANVVYTGDWSYWVTWADGRRKNPDFVVLTPEQYKEYQAGVPINKLRAHTVIEVNGDWWHTTRRGLTKEEREREFVEGYASVGVECVVVWESDLV